MEPYSECQNVNHQTFTKIDQNLSKINIIENFIDNNENDEDILFDQSDFGFCEKLKFEVNENNSLSQLTKNIHENFKKCLKEYNYEMEPFRRELTFPFEGKRF